MPKYKLAIVTTHPIQYYAPVFRALAASEKIDLRVFYTWSQAASSSFDAGFGKDVQWDIPLLEGYSHQFVPNVAKRPGTDHFGGLHTPTLAREIESWGAQAVLVYTWNSRSHLQALRHFKHRVPVLFRGDSTLIDRRTWWRALLRRAVLTWVYSHVDAAIAVGTNNRWYFAWSGVPADRIALAPHSVDTARFAADGAVHDSRAAEWRRELGIDSEAVVILFAGKLQHKKNPRLLLDAFAALKDGSHLVFVGNGELESELRSRAAGIDHVHFMAFQNQSAMPAVYRLGDVFVLPSQGPEETWGLAMNEAMASGRAVIASTRVGGACDLIRPGENGWMFQSGDVADLAGVLRRSVALGRSGLREFGRVAQADSVHWSTEESARLIEEAVLASLAPSRGNIGPRGSIGPSDAEPRLPRRDWILMPALGLLTVALLLASAELAARLTFPQSQTKAIDCMVLDDLSTGVRAIPNSVCWERLAEDRAPIEYKFNSRGYRAGMEHSPKPPGSYRIVMTGSSFAMGLAVARDETFAAILPTELSRETGRRVELYNEGMENGFPHSVDLRFNDVLNADPDLILWVLTPFDIKKTASLLPDRQGPRGSFLLRNWDRLKVGLSTKTVPEAFREIWGRVLEAFDTTRIALLLRHVLYASRAQYVRSYLLGPDDETGFLKADLSEAWQERLREFEIYAEDIEERARRAGVPLVTVMLPNRAQAAMIAMNAWPAGFDPYKLDNELRRMIVSHGGIYVDVLPNFRDVPEPERGYFPVDGHPNARGHAIFSTILAKDLIRGVPGLKP